MTQKTPEELQELSDKLIDGICFGSDDDIKSLYRKDIINTPNQWGKLPLIESVKQPMYFDELIKHNPKLNLKDSTGHTALTFAIAFMKQSVANKLLEKEDINVNITGPFKQTPLHLAVERGLNEIAKKIINKTNNINIQDSGGNTALMIAAKKNNNEIFQILLNKQARVDIINKDDHEVWDLTKNPKIHQALLQTEHYRDALKKAQTQEKIIKAIEEDNLEEIQNIFSESIGVDEPIYPSNHEETPLIFAIKKEKPRIIKYLLDKGAKLNNMDIFGNTALNRALNSKEEQVIYCVQTYLWQQTRTYRYLIKPLSTLWNKISSLFSKKTPQPTHYHHKDKPPTISAALDKGQTCFTKPPQFFINTRKSPLITSIDRSDLVIKVRHNFRNK